MNDQKTKKFHLLSPAINKNSIMSFFNYRPFFLIVERKKTLKI